MAELDTFRGSPAGPTGYKVPMDLNLRPVEPGVRSTFTARLVRD
jgi:hypothetical protein